MKECLECGDKYDESTRTSPFWKKQFGAMGAMADICNKCWKTEHNIDVINNVFNTDTQSSVSFDASDDVYIFNTSLTGFVEVKGGSERFILANSTTTGYATNNAVNLDDSVNAIIENNTIGEDTSRMMIYVESGAENYTFRNN